MSIVSTNPVKFSIQIPNPIKCDDYGNGSVEISKTDLRLPKEAPYTGNDGITNLEELMLFVGPNNVILQWWARAEGEVSDHGCFAVYYLTAYGTLTEAGSTYSVTTTSSTVVWQTERDFGKGGSVNGKWEAIGGSTNKIMRVGYTGNFCDGSCNCRFQRNGGWEKTRVYFMVDVTVYLLDFCTIGQNIGLSDTCYYYVGEYINVNGSNLRIDESMLNYCNTKYPGANLDIFNEPNDPEKPGIDNVKDRNICSCNMPYRNYDEFYNSVKGYYVTMDFGSIRYQCLFPQCVNSHFLPSNLDGCPVPQCLQYVVLEGNEIYNNNIYINQESNCEQVNITPETYVPPPQEPPPSSIPGSEPEVNPPPPTPAPETEPQPLPDIPDENDPSTDTPVIQPTEITTDPPAPSGPSGSTPPSTVGPSGPSGTSGASTTSDEESSSYLWWILGIVIVIILLILIGGGVFFFVKSRSATEAPALTGGNSLFDDFSYD